MFSNRMAFAALAAACVAAAAGGGYLASRNNVAATPAAAQTAPTPESTPASAVQPVQETEAVVGDPKPTAAPPSAPAEAAPPASTAPASVASAASRRADRAARATPRAAKVDEPSARTNSAQPPALERSWPSSANATASSNQTEAQSPAPRVEERAQTEAPRAPEPPAKTFEELVVSGGSVIGLETDTTLSSESARIEDRVEARVVRDVRVNGEVAIPAGTRALGSVVVVERGGKFKERARLGIRFHTLALADGTRMPISTETIYRDGAAPGNGSAAKIGGGAVAGAILGAIIGGGKGAAVGATAGAGAGTATVMAGDRSAATFPAGSEVTARILSPVTVTVEK